MLRVTSGLITAFFFVGWFATLVVTGNVAQEFMTPSQWVPPLFTLAVSIVVFVLTWFAFTQRAFTIMALLYLVAVSYGVAGTQYLGSFAGIPADFMHRDRVGISMVGVWMFAYTAMVPSPPRKTLVALLISATAVPVTYYGMVLDDSAPALPLMGFVLAFVLPYLLIAFFAYAASVMIDRLMREAKRATELGSYELEELLGQGGMGEVWRARHQMLARPAAIKLIRKELLGSEGATREALARFEREAQVTATLQSPHTVQLYDFGVTEDGSLYYVMELLEGMNLDTLVKEFGPMPVERVIHVLLQVCDSLGEAHGRGLVHRDIKPANIQLCRRAFANDFVKVLDFGLVRSQTPVAGSDAADLTRETVIPGTPAFIARELITRDAPVDGRADLYALGCVAYWLLTGRTVFLSRSPTAMLVAQVHETPEPLCGVCEFALPEELEKTVMDCLEKRPANRPATAAELAARLHAIRVETPWTPARADKWWQLHRPQDLSPSGGVTVRLSGR